MKELFRKFSVAYFAGAWGGLFYAVTSWVLGYWGVYAALSVQWTPASLAWQALLPRLLAGSLWALALVPLALVIRLRGLGLGLILSFLPSAYLLLVKYPSMHLGFLGAAKGSLTFAVVLFLNMAWGVVTGLIYERYYRS